MREIKFRAWDKQKKVMVSVETYFLKENSIECRDENKKGWYIESDFELMQYTGQKDKNQKESYEGDIIKTSYNDVYDFALYKIIYKDKEAAFWRECIALHHKKDGYADISKGGYCEGYLEKDLNYEIVGDKYKNPELLSVEIKKGSK